MRRAQTRYVATSAGAFVVLAAVITACASTPPPARAQTDTPSSMTSTPTSATPPTPLVDPSHSSAADASAASSAPDGGVAPLTVTASDGEPDTCAPVALVYEKALRAKLRQCWLDAANKTSDRIIGTVHLVLEIDQAGKIATQRFAEKSDLPAPIQKCMLNAFKAEKIDGTKCDMKTLNIVEKFPR